MENKGWDINKLMSTLHKARWTHEAKQKNEGQQRLLALFQTNVKGGDFSSSAVEPFPSRSLHLSLSPQNHWWHGEKHQAVNGQTRERADINVCLHASGVCVRAPVCFVCDRCAEHQWFIVIRLPRPVCQTEARECCLLCTSMCLIRPEVMVTFAFSWESVLQKRTWCHRSNKKYWAQQYKTVNMRWKRCSYCSVIYRSMIAYHMNNCPSFLKAIMYQHSTVYVTRPWWIMVIFDLPVSWICHWNRKRP